MVRLVKEYAQQMLKRMEQQKRRREKRSQIVASVVSDEDESAKPAVAETGSPLKRRRIVLDDSDLRVCLKYSSWKAKLSGFGSVGRARVS